MDYEINGVLVETGTINGNGITMLAAYYQQVLNAKKNKREDKEDA
jgi:hypothetical protein